MRATLTPTHRTAGPDAARSAALAPPGARLSGLRAAADASHTVARLRALHPRPPVQRADLKDLVMTSGTLAELKGEVEDGPLEIWPELAAALVAASSAEGQVMEDGLIICGKLTIPGPDQAFEIGHFAKGSGILTDDLRLKLGNFLLGFLAANGQLGYIHAQDWFTSGTWNAVLEVNFYPDRAFSEDMNFLGVHKDTDSRNLFVNLIFNNDTDTPATEWTLDETLPDAERMKELAELLPPAELDKILAIKAEIPGLSADTPGKDRFEGGVMGANAYVSWIDELIWHSTPAPKNRERFDKATVLSYLTEIRPDSKWEDYYRLHELENYKAEYTPDDRAAWMAHYQDNGDSEDAAALRLSAMIDKYAEDKVKTNSANAVAAEDRYLSAALSVLFSRQADAFRDIPKPADLRQAKILAGNLATASEEPWTGYKARILDGVEKINWSAERASGFFGDVEVLNPDRKTYAPARQVHTGAGGRPRANSETDIQAQVTAAIERMKDIAAKAARGPDAVPQRSDLPKRSFIRTWVTLVRA